MSINAKRHPQWYNFIYIIYFKSPYSYKFNRFFVRSLRAAGAMAPPRQPRVRKRHLTREIRQRVANIQIRPEAWTTVVSWDKLCTEISPSRGSKSQDFEDYLQNAIGFEKVDVIEPPGGGPKKDLKRRSWHHNDMTLFCIHRQ